MTSALESALESALVSFQLHVGSRQWKVKQLHRLVKLVVDSREELYHSIGKVCGISRDDFELGIAGFLSDVKHLLDFLQPDAVSRWYLPRRTGPLRAASQPKGVSLIVTEADEPFRNGLSAFAASIAAGNAVVLMYRSQKLQPFAKLLEAHTTSLTDFTDMRILGRYDLAPETLNVVSDLDILLISDHATKLIDFNMYPMARYLPVQPGLTLIVVDNERRSPIKIAQVISKRIDQKMRVDPGPCLILVDQNVQAAFIGAFSSTQSERGWHLKVWETTPTVEGLQSQLVTTKLVHQVDVMATTSLEHSISCVQRLQKSRSLMQLAMFSSSSANLQYVESFSRSRIFVCCDILIRPPLVLNTTGQSETTFPAEYFAHPRLGYTRLPNQPPGETLTETRKFYMGLIKPLKPEPRGERIDFFVQMAWFVKTIKTLMWGSGLLATYGGVLLLRRYLGLVS